MELKLSTRDMLKITQAMTILQFDGVVQTSEDDVRDLIEELADIRDRVPETHELHGYLDRMIDFLKDKFNISNESSIGLV